jgi:Uri superfamily endonuclease
LQVSELLRTIDKVGISGQYCIAETVHAETIETGAYLLLMQFVAPIELSLRKQDTAKLEAGSYVYSGSAKGPGGLRSRLRHHFRKTKKSHWHVDQLTTQCIDLAALSVIDGDECQFIYRLLEHSAFCVPFRHFGSTDCRSCESHLLQFNY